MALLILGLVLFFVAHLSSLAGPAKKRLRTRMGEPAFLGLYSLISLGGLALMVIGYQAADGTPHGLYLPPDWAKSTAHAAMPIAFILVAGGSAPTNFRRLARHPMAIGVLIWAVIHLIANHTVEDLVLFGAFAIYALLDIFVVGASKPMPPRQPPIRDVLAVAGGFVIYAVVVYVHNQFVPIFS